MTWPPTRQGAPSSRAARCRAASVTADGGRDRLSPIRRTTRRRSASVRPDLIPSTSATTRSSEASASGTASHPGAAARRPHGTGRARSPGLRGPAGSSPGASRARPRRPTRSSPDPGSTRRETRVRARRRWNIAATRGPIPPSSITRSAARMASPGRSRWTLCIASCARAAPPGGRRRAGCARARRGRTGVRAAARRRRRRSTPSPAPTLPLPHADRRHRPPNGARPPAARPPPASPGRPAAAGRHRRSGCRARRAAWHPPVRTPDRDRCPTGEARGQVEQPGQLVRGQVEHLGEASPVPRSGRRRSLLPPGDGRPLDAQPLGQALLGQSEGLPPGSEALTSGHLVPSVDVCPWIVSAEDAVVPTEGDA
jgi:hypothetical protein